MDLKSYQQKLLSGNYDFDAMAEWLWAHQYRGNPVMRDFVDRLDGAAQEPRSMPISFFKHFEMLTGKDWTPKAVFASSGTTGQTPSQHFVKDVALYKAVTEQGFYQYFANQPYQIFALLPSYLERGNSSLVYMVRHWIDRFGLPGSGFYLNDFQALATGLKRAAEENTPILLIGVAFALLDLAEEYTLELPSDAIVIETGGMKGRRTEIIRSELHQHLRAGLGVETIHSEYGMTELMSQAYTQGGNRFYPAPSLRVRISDLHLNRLSV
ncbi:MAG: acyl transferase, partial [Bacteroidota bacterium]